MRNLIGGQKKMREYQLADGRKTPLEDQIGFDIRPYTKKVIFKPREYLFHEGAEAEYLYFLERGCAKVMRNQENGRKMLSNFLKAPAFIGEMELLEAKNCTNEVTALTTCICYRIYCKQCKDQLLNDSKFLRSLCTDLFARLACEVDNFSKNLSYPLEIRLAHFILESSINNLYCTKHTEAAAYLGVSYRHFLYVLAKFVQKGWIEKTAQGYWITDANGLKTISCNIK